MMNGYNKNMLAIADAYKAGKRGIVLEGGSRSRKTWSVIDFLIALSSSNAHRDTTTLIIKETYNLFKTTLFDDFNKRLPDFGLFSPFENVKECSNFQMFRNKFHLIGADKVTKTMGVGSDFFWINESLPISKEIFDQYEQRCRSFWIMDYNPIVTDHWQYALEKRDDVAFCRSTMLDNPMVPKWEKVKILSYEDTPYNREQGTVDDYMWKVFGLGLRGSPQGVYFPNVTYIDTFPEDIETVGYGMDFGHSISSTTLMKVGLKGNDLFIECLFYAPCDDIPTLAQVIRKANPEMVLWADSAEPGMISDLRYQNISVFGSKNYPGVVQHGIASMNKYKIHAVRHLDLKREFENYKRREVGGVVIDEPIKGFCHAIDGARYAFMNTFRFE